MTVSVIHGLVPAVVAGLGVLGLGWLLAVRGRRWWLRRVPAAMLAAVVVTAALVLLVDRVWRPFPDALPPVVVWCVAWAVFAACLAPLRWPAVRGWRRWLLVPLSTVLVLLAAASAVNVFYGQYPTLGALLGVPLADQVDVGHVTQATTEVAAPPGQPLAGVWRAPVDLPAHGSVTKVRIPPVRSGFAARPALIYLPPAYLSTPRARLPVLVMLSGQPGEPRNWFDAGHLAQRMDRFAAAHQGLAPVVVVPDILGDTLHNPLCMNSRLGQAATYLDVDVPAWVRDNLQVDPDHRHWAVGGLSSGGTCALQAGVRAPQVYPTMLDISGQDEPTLGSRSSTVQAAFGGNEAAFRAVNPLDLLAAHRFPDSAAFLAVGDRDAVYEPQQRRVAAALEKAGVPVRFEVLPGEHTWGVWGQALDVALPWLAARLALV